MNSETKRLLREKWPHIAEDLIAVDEAADKWLKWRADLYRPRRSAAPMNALILTYLVLIVLTFIVIVILENNDDGGAA